MEEEKGREGTGRRENLIGEKKNGRVGNAREKRTGKRENCHEK